MTRQVVCSLVGEWRIVEADLWDQDHLDLVGPAHITFRGDGRAEIAFGALNVGLDCEYSPSIRHRIPLPYRRQSGTQGAPMVTFSATC